ncbi:MAG: hypothetical protein IJ800_02760 [Clostridia bacterium]|nr:hypothetical protein [Clostridia bacterium]
MKELTFQVIAEKFGMEIFGLAVIVCLISAFIKKKVKLSGRTSTLLEVGISFVLVALYLSAAQKFNVEGLLNNVLSVTGVSLAVCGIICGGSNGLAEEIKQTLLKFGDGDLTAEELKSTLLKSKDLDLSDEEAELFAVTVTKFNNAQKNKLK